MLYSSPVISKLLPIYGDFYRLYVSFFWSIITVCIIRPDLFPVCIIALNHQRNKGTIYIKKTRKLTKNKLCHNLQLKSDSFKDFITVISGEALKVCWKKAQLYFIYPMKFLVEAWSFSKNRLWHRLSYCHL